MEIPKSIVKAEAVDLNTSNKLVLGVRENSHCHFFDRFPVGRYEVQLRLDWTDLDVNRDPKLDADIFLPGDTKHVKGSKRFPAHHTPKQKDISTGLHIYKLIFEGVELSLQIQFARQHQISGRTRIVRAPEDQVMDPALSEWLNPDKS